MFSRILPLLALAAAIVALARPQLSNAFTRVESSGIDIMIVLDVSRSMLAEDYRGEDGRRANRINTVKKITRQFIEQRPADRIGLSAFAGRPYLVSPLTLDHGWLLQQLDRLRIGLVEDGTAIGSALASAASRLKDSQAKSRIIVLLSDGGNNAGRVAPATAAEAAAALGLKVYTIGAGSQGPAPYPVTDALGRTIYTTIEADLDEDVMKEDRRHRQRPLLRRPRHALAQGNLRHHRPARESPRSRSPNSANTATSTPGRSPSASPCSARISPWRRPCGGGRREPEEGPRGWKMENGREGVSIGAASCG